LLYRKTKIPQYQFSIMNAMKNIKSNPTPIRPFHFELPDGLECSKPTEERGIARDEVRLMVSHRKYDQIQHSTFKNIGDFLQEGDVLVVNTSGTLKAAISGKLKNGEAVNIHFSTKQSNDQWVVEIRKADLKGTKRFNNGKAGDIIQLDKGGHILLKRPYYQQVINKSHLQLWVVEINIEGTVEDYLDQYGIPIRYSYQKEIYPQSYYQTVFANEMGSAEMPSAGRAFTPELVTQLIAKGIQIVPILLHTGVASLESNEKPYEEYYRVSNFHAKLLNNARAEGRRIIAVGTTVVRALESCTDRFSFTIGGAGWTDIFITPERGLFAVDGLLTGFHEPKASHLLMLEALADRQHLILSYESAIQEKYRWHEFGDLHLIL